MTTRSAGRSTSSASVAAATAAQADLDAAKAAIDSIAKAGANAVQQADDGVRLAKLRQTDALKPKDTSALSQALADAKNSKRQADADLAQVETQVGTSVPAGEILFLPTLPLRVDDIKVRPGDALSGYKVRQILAAAETALGGGTLSAGYTYSSLSTLCDNLNLSWDTVTPDGCMP